MFVLLDTKTMALIRITETVEQAEYLAEMEIPKSHDFLITGTTERDFWCFPEKDLALLLSRLTEKAYGWSDMTVSQFSFKIGEEIHRCIERGEIDKTPVEELEKKLGRKVDPIDPRPSEEERPVSIGGRGGKSRRKPSDPSAPPSRPKAGTATGKVWEIADSMPEADRAEVIAACEAEGINASTAKTQYGKWRKAQ